MGSVPCFAGDEIADHLHRTRAVECIHRHEIADVVGFSFRSQSRIPELSNWKTATVSPRAKRSKVLGIVLRDGLEVDLTPWFSRISRRQFSITESVRSPRKSILRRPAVLEVLHVVLGHDLGVRGFVQRDVIADLPRERSRHLRHAFRHSCSSLQAPRKHDTSVLISRPGTFLDPFEVRNRIEGLAERRTFPCSTGMSVDLVIESRAQGNAEDPAHVLQDGAGGKSAERNDLETESAPYFCVTYGSLSPACHRRSPRRYRAC